MAQNETNDNEILADIAAMIVRETIRIRGDAKLSISPYSDDVKALVAGKLTHSERKAAGLVDPNEPDPLEMALRAHAENRESFYLGLKYNPFRRLVGTDALGIYLSLNG
jgi:hypothetical protein